MEEKRGPGRPPKEEPKKSPGRVHPEDYHVFFGPLDKGAAKPAFCYPERTRILKEEVRKMERNIEMGYISPERKLAYESRLKARRERLDAINENAANAHKIVTDNPDYWAKRRRELGKEIRAAMPSRKDVEKRRVNPHRVAKMEKEGLGEKKREYIIISRALGEESNTSFLQRD
jgi:hypothetical protein